MGWLKKPLAATEEEAAALAALRERAEWQVEQAPKFWRLIVGKGGIPYHGTVRRGVIVERRKRNKAARAARRHNRG